LFHLSLFFVPISMIWIAFVFFEKSHVVTREYGIEGEGVRCFLLADVDASGTFGAGSS